MLFSDGGLVNCVPTQSTMSHARLKSNEDRQMDEKPASHWKTFRATPFQLSQFAGGRLKMLTVRRATSNGCVLVVGRARFAYHIDQIELSIVASVVVLKLCFH